MNRVRLFLGGYVNYLNAQNINCRALSEHLDKDRFEVWTMLYWHQSAKDFEKTKGIHYLTSHRPVRLLGWITYLRGIFHCDVAYLPKGEYIYLCRLLGKLFRCKIFTTIEGLISGTNLDKIEQTKYGLSIYKVYQPYVYAITRAISSQVKRDLMIDTQKRVLHLGVEYDQFSRERSIRGFQSIVFVGNNIKYKGIEDVLRMAKVFPTLRFHCVGGNLMRQGLLENYIEQNSINNVEYHGLLDHSHLSALLQDMDLMFFPSRSEGFPKVMLETACAGVPTLCYGDYGADEWITSGVNGFVVNTFEEAKSVIQELIDHPERLNMLSQNAVELGKRFDWKVLVKDWEEEIIRIAKS